MGMFLILIAVGLVLQELERKPPPVIVQKNPYGGDDYL
jgi:hypothetical protein